MSATRLSENASNSSSTFSPKNHTISSCPSRTESSSWNAVPDFPVPSRKHDLVWPDFLCGFMLLMSLHVKPPITTEPTRTMHCPPCVAQSATRPAMPPTCLKQHVLPPGCMIVKMNFCLMGLISLIEVATYLEPEPSTWNKASPAHQAFFMIYKNIKHEARMTNY